MSIRTQVKVVLSLEGLKEKSSALNKKCTAKKDDFETLRWPYVTFNDLHGHTLFMKNLRLYNVSIHRTFYQNRFINECARKIKVQILGISELRKEFFVSYRRTYILNKIKNFFVIFITW